MTSDQFNVALFEGINAFAGRSAVLDLVARISADYLPVIFMAWLIVVWCRRERMYKHIALLAGYATLLGLGVNFLITVWYFHPRPFMAGIGTLLIRHAPETSFPSDHTTFMLSIAGTLLRFEQSRRSGLILFALGLFGGLARVYCGLHFPLDIVGSLVIALLSSNLVFRTRQHLSRCNDMIIGIVLSASRRIRLQPARDRHVH